MPLRGRIFDKLNRVKNSAYLSLGSNVGDREANLHEAIAKLAEAGTVVAVSSFYETEPMEFTEQPWFLNCAVAVETEKNPQQFLSAVLEVERGMGRKRERPKGPRNIDIDIVLFGDAVIDEQGLTIPHPALHERRFVLAPLAEIAANVIHPMFERSVGELLDELPESAGTVRKL